MIYFAPQAQVIQQSGENAKLKLKERELQQENEYLKTRLQGGDIQDGPYQNSGGPLLFEPTETEYLRNILFEYMLGKETKVRCSIPVFQCQLLVVVVVK